MDSAEYEMLWFDEVDNTEITMSDVMGIVDLGCGATGLKRGISLEWHEKDQIEALKRLCTQYPDVTFDLRRYGHYASRPTKLWARNGTVRKYDAVISWDFINGVNVTNIYDDVPQR